MEHVPHTLPIPVPSIDELLRIAGSGVVPEALRNAAADTLLMAVEKLRQRQGAHERNLEACADILDQVRTALDTPPGMNVIKWAAEEHARAERLYATWGNLRKAIGASPAESAEAVARDLMEDRARLDFLADADLYQHVNGDKQYVVTTGEHPSFVTSRGTTVREVLDTARAKTLPKG